MRIVFLSRLHWDFFLIDAIIILYSYLLFCLIDQSIGIPNWIIFYFIFRWIVIPLKQKTVWSEDSNKKPRYTFFFIYISFLMINQKFHYFFILNRYQCWTLTSSIFELLPALCVRERRPWSRLKKVVKQACLGPKKTKKKTTERAGLEYEKLSFVV